MFFTHLGKIIAHLGFWSGLLKVVFGFFFAFRYPEMEQNMFVARRYLAAATTGEAINEGVTVILGSVALGILAEISSRRA